jgi:thiosulfate/3-mercaptopyruvate sulfurtransferase
MLVPILLIASLAPAAAGQSPEPMVVTTAWLSEHLGDRDLVIFHIGDARTKATYDAGHIPGARFLNPWEDISAPRQEGALNLELPSAERLTAALRAHGVNQRSRIVLYQSDQYYSPIARAYLTLEFAGLGGKVSVMDGGLELWKREGRPVSTDAPASAAGDFTPQLHPEVVVDVDFVRTRLENPKVAVLDARLPSFYEGAETRQGRNGHIPGALNVPFSSVMAEDGRFKDLGLLREMFQKAGAEPGDKVVTYCHIGQQASLVWFAAKLSGYDASVYDGSFQDWAARTDLPVVAPKPATPP